MSQEQSTATQTKSTNWIGIVSYLWWPGWIVSMILKSTNDENKTEFNSFHIRQMLGLLLLSFLDFIPRVGTIIGLILLVAWVIGFVGAVQGKKTEIPVIGTYFQQWFSGI